VIRFRCNGQEVVVPASGRRLLDVLRVDLGLWGTKEGCGEGECGACSVLIGRDVANSCLVPVSQVDGESVTTIEGLRDEALARAFVEEGGAQCGICTPGMMCAASALLATRPQPTLADVQVGLAGNLCRCTGYTKIFAAVLRAARERSP
jgi:aerobic-type carbon monoxide dehydrogenase small subunit (CoxS/CutS family)